VELTKSSDPGILASFTPEIISKTVTSNGILTIGKSVVKGRHYLTFTAIPIGSNVPQEFGATQGVVIDVY
jgi:hypothetical protein